MSVPIIISQGALSPPINNEPARKDLEEDVDLAIAEISKQSTMRRQLFEAFSLRDLHDQPPMPQSREERAFVNDLFYEKAKRYNLTNREMILGSLNTYPFTSYHALLEDTLQKIHYDTFGQQTREKQLTGWALISVCLKEIIDHKGYNIKFLEELGRRSEFFTNLETLCKFWKIINFMRNKLVHFSGRIGSKALETMQEMTYAVFKTLKDSGADGQAIAFVDTMQALEKNIRKTGLLQLNNSVENLMRNTCMNIVESLLICDRAQKPQQKSKGSNQSVRPPKTNSAQAHDANRRPRTHHNRTRRNPKQPNSPT